MGFVGQTLLSAWGIPFSHLFFLLFLLEQALPTIVVSFVGFVLEPVASVLVISSTFPPVSV